MDRSGWRIYSIRGLYTPFPHRRSRYGGGEQSSGGGLSESDIPGVEVESGGGVHDVRLRCRVGSSILTGRTILGKWR